MCFHPKMVSSRDMFVAAMKKISFKSLITFWLSHMTTIDFSIPKIYSSWRSILPNNLFDSITKCHVFYLYRWKGNA